MEDFLKLLVETVWFFLPAFLGNLSPVIGKHFFKRVFSWRLDGGNSLNGQPLFGSHKTVGGLIAAVMGGGVGGAIVMFVGSKFLEGSHIGGLGIRYVYLGLLMGLGAILGDLFKSFWKRRLAIPAGQAWWFFDQDDFVVGAWLFSGLFISYLQSWPYFLMAMVVTPPVHLALNILAFKLKLKKVWW